MQITFSEESFRGTKLFVATPMYGGMCTYGYMKGMVDLTAACAAYKIPMQLHDVTDQGLVVTARNAAVSTFLKSDYTHFLFIDADIDFSSKDALTLLHLSHTDEEKKYDVIGGPYPKKGISWRKVKRAVEKGFADKDPNLLKNYTANYVFLAKPGSSFSYKAPVEVMQTGTGFMMIPKRTFLSVSDAYPEKNYLTSEGKKEHAFFDCEIDPETNRYLPEDYLFCHKVQKNGGRVWLAPWLTLAHQGMYSFEGSLAYTAALGMSPTDE